MAAILPVLTLRGKQSGQSGTAAGGLKSFIQDGKKPSKYCN